MQDQCDRSTFAREVHFFYDEVVGVIKFVTCAVFPRSYLNFTIRGVLAAGGRSYGQQDGVQVVYKIRFVGWGSDLCG
jgi:hypothetical protein